jgi:PAS domain S-box-containing protein
MSCSPDTDDPSRQLTDLREKLEHTEAALVKTEQCDRQESEERFRQMVKHSPLAMYMWRLEGDGRLVFTGANPAADRLLGIDHRQFLGKTVEEAFPPVAGTGLPSAYRRIAAEGGSWTAPEYAYEDGLISGIFEVHAYQSSPGAVAVMFSDQTARRRAEAELRQNAARLRAIAEQMPCVLWTTDLNLRFTSSYGSGLKAMGLKPGEVVGGLVEDFFEGQGEKEAVLGRHRRAFAGETVTYETNAFGRSYLTYLEPLRDEGGIIIGALGAAFDITERKRAQEALQQSESHLRLIASQVPGGIWTTDRNLRFTSFYAAEREDLQLKPWHVVGMELEDFFASDEEKKVSVAAHQRACAGETVVYESRVYGRDYFNYLEPLKNRGGEIIGVLGIALDITQRLRTEAALRASEEKYHRFFEENLAGYYLMSAAGKLLECNPAFARMFGFGSREEALEHDLANLYPNPRALAAFVALVRGQGRLEQHARELRSKDGRAIRVVENAIGAFDAGGQLTEIRGYLIDDTEHWKAEQQFRQAQKMDAIGRLAGGVAHDFNNLLTVIKGYSDLVLKKLPAADPLKADIGEILKAGEKASELVQQLLAFSRQQPTEPRPLDLNVVISDSARMIERLIGEDIQLETRLQPSLAAARADAGQINQILVNLAVNAKDAMPGGGRLAIQTAEVEVDAAFAAARAGLAPGHYVLLTVTDSGVGMDARTLAHIFEPFFTTKAPGEGVGLGLSTVYGIVKQNGGWIGVRSEPGQGTAFQIYWPQAEPGLVAAEAAPHPSATMTRGAETILLVEDQEQVRTIVQNVLIDCGYRVLTYADGASALQFAESNPGAIDLLLTDVVMPGMSGPELAERLRARQPEIKVVYISGYSGDAIAHRGIRESGVAYLPKPFSAAELSIKVREVLGGPRG